MTKRTGLTAIPFTWQEVTDLDEFKSLSREEQQQAKQRYFANVVAPTIRARDGDLSEAWAVFDSNARIPQAPSSPTDISRAAGLLGQERGAVEPQTRAAKGLVQSALDFLGDAGLSLMQGTVQVPEALAGLADLQQTSLREPINSMAELAGIKHRMPTNLGVLKRMGVDFGGAKQDLDGWKSDELQAANKAVSEAKGFFETLKTAKDNWRSVADQGVQSVPAMFAGGGMAGAISRSVGRRAGQIAIERALAAGATETEAQIAGRVASTEAASRMAAISSVTEGAQSAGQQAAQYAEQGDLSTKKALASLGAGLTTSLIGRATSMIPGLGDAVSSLAINAIGKGVNRATDNLLARVVKTGIREGLIEEMPQSATEQMWQNIGEGKPLLEGVGNAAAVGLLTGASMGGGGEVLHRTGEHPRGDRGGHEGAAASTEGTQGVGRTGEHEVTDTIGLKPEDLSGDSPAPKLIEALGQVDRSTVALPQDEYSQLREQSPPAAGASNPVVPSQPRGIVADSLNKAGISTAELFGQPPQQRADAGLVTVGEDAMGATIPSYHAAFEQPVAAAREVTAGAPSEVIGLVPGSTQKVQAHLLTPTADGRLPAQAGSDGTVELQHEKLDHRPGGGSDLSFARPLTMDGARQIGNEQIQSDVLLSRKALPSYRVYQDGKMKIVGPQTRLKTLLSEIGVGDVRTFPDRDGLFVAEPDVARVRSALERTARRQQVVADADAARPQVSRSSTSGSGLHVVELEHGLRRRLENVGDIAKVVQSANDLPLELRRRIDPEAVEGLYWSGKTGRRSDATVWLVADNLDSIERAHEVLSHELIGHYAQEQLIDGGDFTRALDSVLRLERAGSTVVLRLAQRVDASQPELAKQSPRVRAKEILAQAVETGEYRKSPALIRLVADIVRAVKAQLRKLGFRQAWISALSEQEVYSLLREGERRLTEGARPRNEPSAQVDGKATTVQSKTRPILGSTDLTDPVVHAWKMLAQADHVFRHGRPNSFDLVSIAKETDPKMQVSDDSTMFPPEEMAQQGLTHIWSVTTPDGASATVMENRHHEVWVDASMLSQGASGGSKLYAAVSSYAAANGKQFIGDSRGLSDAALIRRTEQMISSALKEGGTAHLVPHERQIAPHGYNPGSKINELVRPLKWKVGEDANNLTEMLRTSQHNLKHLVPGVAGELSHVRYNFERQRFERDGSLFSDYDFRLLADQAATELRTRGFDNLAADVEPAASVGRSQVDGELDPGREVAAAGGADSRGSGNYLATDREPGGESVHSLVSGRSVFGSTTLKRSVLTDSIARAAGDDSWRSVLAGLSEYLSGEHVDSQLEGILYSRRKATKKTASETGFSGASITKPADSRWVRRGAQVAAQGRSFQSAGVSTAGSQRTRAPHDFGAKGPAQRDSPPAERDASPLQAAHQGGFSLPFMLTPLSSGVLKILGHPREIQAYLTQWNVGDVRRSPTKGGVIVPRRMAPRVLEAVEHHWTRLAKINQADDLYKRLPLRPGTMRQQLETGKAAFNDLDLQREEGARWQGGRWTRQLASVLAHGYRAAGGNVLNGQYIGGPHDLAVLAQVLRDPRFETTRVFYVDTIGKVVGSHGFTSKLPGVVYLPDDHIEVIARTKAQLGAVGYWLLHNHPNGRATPSDDDIEATEQIAQEVPGFRGHVIIDHDEYGLLLPSRQGGLQHDTVDAPELVSVDLDGKPHLPHPILGRSLHGPRALADIAKQLQIKDGYIVVVAADHMGRVRAATEVAVSVLVGQKGDPERKRAIAELRQASVDNGAGGYVFAVTPLHPMHADYAPLRESGLLLDVVGPRGESAFALGAMADWQPLVTKTERKGHPPKFYALPSPDFVPDTKARSRAIRAWFANSKATEDGRSGGVPKVYYRYTSEAVREDGVPRIFFAADQQQQGRHPKQLNTRGNGLETTAPLPVYLRATRPFEMGETAWKELSRELNKAVNQASSLGVDFNVENVGSLYDRILELEARDWEIDIVLHTFLRALGYDSLRYTNEGVETIGVLSTDAIVSATNSPAGAYLEVGKSEPPPLQGHASHQTAQPGGFFSSLHQGNTSVEQAEGLRQEAAPDVESPHVAEASSLGEALDEETGAEQGTEFPDEVDPSIVGGEYTRLRVGPNGKLQALRPSPSNPSVMRWLRVGAREISNRLKYMGLTPGKDSPIGRIVQARMRAAKTLRGEKAERRGEVDTREVLGSDGKWYPFAEADMGHVRAAVDFWNEIGRYFGPKSFVVRQFMQNPRNYMIEPRSQNRKNGASMGVTYSEPATEADKVKFFEERRNRQKRKP